MSTVFSMMLWMRKGMKAKVLVASLTISPSEAPSSSISLISGYLAMMEKTSATPPKVKATG